jgi:hypothetical protein
LRFAQIAVAIGAQGRWADRRYRACRVAEIPTCAPFAEEPGAGAAPAVEQRARRVVIARGDRPVTPDAQAQVASGPTRRALKRLASRGGGEDGVILVMVAMLLVVILGMAALAIDTGSFDQAETRAQAAADAGRDGVGDDSRDDLCAGQRSGRDHKRDHAL